MIIEGKSLSIEGGNFNFKHRNGGRGMGRGHNHIGGHHGKF
jgi:hypothetical protein